MTYLATRGENDMDTSNHQAYSMLHRRQRAMRGGTCTVVSYGLYRPVPEPLSKQAIDVFLCNMVVPSSENSISAGYFTGLFPRFQSSSPSDTLPWALEAVALAAFANRFGVREARFLAIERYGRAISQLRSANFKLGDDTSHLLTCILLLSMYELVSASSIDSLIWLQHLHGLSAVMKNLVRTDRISANGIPALILGTDSSSSPHDECTPHCQDTPDAAGPSGFYSVQSEFHGLCSILPRVQSLFKRSNQCFDTFTFSYQSELQQIWSEAHALKSELLIWAISQPEATQYSAIHYFTQSYTLRFSGTQDLVCPATRADVYRDYFTACMWISYRQCLLHLIDLLDRVNCSLCADPAVYLKSREHKKNLDETRTLVHAICASIPFMLGGSGINSTKPSGAIWAQSRPPMLVGGLTLQWAFFTVSILGTVDMNVKAEMRALLLWMGSNLGIGQATVLARTDKNPAGGLTARGNALNWMGFLT